MKIIRHYLELTPIQGMRSSQNPISCFHLPAPVINSEPLIYLWTLRFEGNHTYFRQCAAHKSIAADFSGVFRFWQHISSSDTGWEGNRILLQWLQSQIKKACPLFDFAPNNTTSATGITREGTKCVKWLFVVRRGKDVGELLVGEIKLILIQCDSQVHFVGERHQAVHLFHLSVYSLKDIAANCTWICLRREDLLDYYALPACKVYNLSVRNLHHSSPAL